MTLVRILSRECEISFYLITWEGENAIAKRWFVVLSVAHSIEAAVGVVLGVQNNHVSCIGLVAGLD